MQQHALRVQAFDAFVLPEQRQVLEDRLADTRLGSQPPLQGHSLWMNARWAAA